MFPAIRFISILSLVNVTHEFRASGLTDVAQFLRFHFSVMEA